MKKSYLFVLLSSLLLIVGLAVTLIYADRIPENPADTIGNTAGNLNNGGYFCEANGKVFFSNASDNGSLCSMNVDESDCRTLATLKVGNILAGGDYLYFFQTGSSSEGAGFGQIKGMKSFDRIKQNGSAHTALTKAVVIRAQLVGNQLYMLLSQSSGPLFCKMNTDKSNYKEFIHLAINPACAQQGMIYYNGVEDDHYLYRLDTSDDIPETLWKGNLWYPIIDGDYVYYMDVANHYRICRYSFSQNQIEILTNDRADCFNVAHGYLYYQKNGTNPQLICMRADGTDAHVIADGNYTHLNMTSAYLYFQDFNDPLTLYHTALGSSTYSVFSPTVQPGK